VHVAVGGIGRRLSFGGSVPAEFVTCCALLCSTRSPEAAIAIAAIEPPLTKARRAIMLSSQLYVFLS
jgi:hypothetical protein